MLVFHYGFVETLHPVLDNAYNMTDKHTAQGDALRAPSIWNNLEVAGWIILAIFVFVGIIDLILSSQKDEYEPYQYQQ
jgi:hypothetical protein